MRDRGREGGEAESFIKINLKHAWRSCVVLRRSRPVVSHTCFQHANRKAGRPQSSIKCVTPCVWECLLIYGLFAVMPTILNLKGNKFSRVVAEGHEKMTIILLNQGVLYGLLNDK